MNYFAREVSKLIVKSLDERPKSQDGGYISFFVWFIIILFLMI